MPTKGRESQRSNPAAELLRDLLILELAKAGVPQPKIRTIVGCAMHRVSQIARHFKKAKRQAAE